MMQGEISMAVCPGGVLEAESQVVLVKSVK
jgi:hypothetical protein